MPTNALYYGDNWDVLRAFYMPPTNITLAPAESDEAEESGEDAVRDFWRPA